MLESLINPKRAEKGPWKMFFIGLLYASLSILMVSWVFGGDSVLSQYLGILVVTFCVMFSLPFMYFIIKKEEEDDEEVSGFWGVWNIHKDAIHALMWLFMGFVVAFSFWYILLGNPSLFNAQIETYCKINSPSAVGSCIERYYQIGSPFLEPTGAATRELWLLAIIENNVYVMIFTVLLSLVFGAGAIFVLAWNASVISAAIAIFTENQLRDIPLGLLRYMIHGIPEIAAYFVAALAGGIFGIGVLRHGFRGKKFMQVFENVIILLVIALAIIVFAAIIEVYFTPLLFR